MGPITVVSAGAGTGKTYRLSGEYVTAVGQGISPARVIATTFTNKAADELLERVRGRLLKEGMAGEAHLALAGLVGTVNSICGRLVADFAIDAGLSPVADVIHEEMADLLFAIAAEPAISRHAATIEPLAERLSQDDWRETVRTIINLARGNGLSPTAVCGCASRSWAGLAPLLAPVAEGKTAEDLDRALDEAIRQAIAAIADGGDNTKKTTGEMEVLRQVAARLATGRKLSWAEWARLTKLDVAKASQPAVRPVIDAAGRHKSHPRLAADLRALIEAIFTCAADAMDGFAAYKRERGLLDFADQETLALDLLGRDGVKELLAERFDLLLVDEFQDTSPIQLALFLELATVVRRSVWVGDQKQAIFGFRGADPELVNAVAGALVPGSGGTEEYLDTSFRSRPALVTFANALFGAAFPHHGIPAAKVIIPHTDRTVIQGMKEALNHWMLDGKSWDKSLAALAARIRALLDDPATLPVVGTDGLPRPLRASDISILCRANDRCAKVAGALAAAGIRSAMPRSGLLATPEAIVARAALRYLVDPGDTLAAAEIIHLSAGLAGDGAWLADWLAEGGDAIKARHPGLRALDGARAQLPHLTPAEALEAAITAAEVDLLVRRWGQAGERLANLDAVRRLARLYEDACRTERGAATAAGLVAWLDTSVADGGERPAFEDDDAVRVLTYHKAKGLEWPVVILLDLHDGPKRNPFGVFSQPPVKGFDPWRPLAGRWIRFWPWPYGDHTKKVHIDETSAASPEAGVRTTAELAELARLLYVGVTRARDYLILATRQKDKPTWLDGLADGNGQPLLALPTTPGVQSVTIADASVSFAVEQLPEAAATALAPTPSDGIAWYGPPLLSGDPPSYPPAWLSPSRTPSSTAIADAPTEVPIILGSRLPLTGNPDIRLVGEAVHGFLAADDLAAPVTDRLAMATAILERWGVAGALLSASLVEASDRLDRFITAHWPKARRHHEVPVVGGLGNQRVSGRIDLLLEDDEGFIVIDHKSFPGAFDQWPIKAREYAPQLALYGQMVEQATGKKMRQCLVHMPIVGAVMDAIARDQAESRT